MSGDCEIEALAKDLQIERVCLDYLQAKTLKHGEWHEEASAILKRSGISDDLSLFIAMENTYNEFINEKRKQANGK